MTPLVTPASRPILFTVCAWHTPKAELDALSKQYPGQISHGLCPACALLMERETA